MHPEATASLLTAPAGALRILARNGDREVLIVHGDERTIGDGERLISC